MVFGSPTTIEPKFRLEDNGWLMPNDVLAILSPSAQSFIKLLGAAAANIPQYSYKSEHDMRFLHSYVLEVGNVVLPFGSCEFYQEQIW
jgi:hypothetical protein